MSTTPGQQKVIKFGAFEVDLTAGEVRKFGMRQKLPGQPFQVLQALLERPQEIITREELRERLWPDKTSVDYDLGLKKAISRLREMLGDTAENPHFIETVPRRGYRFIASLTTQRRDRQDYVQNEGGLQRHWKRTLVGTTVLLLVLTGAYILRRQPMKAAEKLTAVPLTSYPGFETMPSFSPDGNEIAFSWYHTTEQFGTTMKADLYVKQVGKERAIRLTNHEAIFLVPAWSPDGRSLAFAMSSKDGNGIYLMPALGGPERRLAEISENSYQWMLLSWSSDSKRVAFAKADSTAAKASAEHYRIHLVDVEMAKEWVLPHPSIDCATEMEPAFSPDGKYLATVCTLGDNFSRIYVRPTDDGDPHEVTLIRDLCCLDGLAWTTDNQSILYASRGSLWRVPAVGGKAEELPFGQSMRTPAVARHGRRLAYAQAKWHSDIWRIALATPTRPIGPESRFMSSSQNQQNARISPDGKHIAFESDRSGNYEIWRCDRDGSNAVQLSFFGDRPAGAPRWSPDSRWIVFDVRASDHGESYVVNADGGAVRRLMTSTPDSETPFWSADGQWIYFSTERPEAVWKVSSEGGTAIRLTKEGRIYPQESPDRKRIFYVVEGDRCEVWSVPVDGGEELREDGMPSLRKGLETSWVLARNGIYFMDGAPSDFFIEYFDFSTRHVRRVSELKGLGFVWGGIGLSPNNDVLLYSGVDRGDSDILLVEGFQ